MMYILMIPACDCTDFNCVFDALNLKLCSTSRGRENNEFVSKYRAIMQSLTGISFGPSELYVFICIKEHT